MTNINNNANVGNTTTKKNDLANRQFFLNSNVTAEKLEDIILGILEINRQDDASSKSLLNFERKPINFIIDSYGGNVYDGLALVSIIKNSKTPVHTYCYGKAMSMGLILFSVGHKRFTSKYATIMQHQLSGGTIGKLNDMVEDVAQATRLQEVLDDILVEHTKISRGKLLSLRNTKTDWYFDGAKAVELGVADELI